MKSTRSVGWTPGRTGTYAFSLYELLVVIAVLGVLGVLLGVSASIFTKWKKRSKMGACTENLHELGKALRLYSQDNRGYLPYAGIVYDENREWSWDDFLNAKLSDHWSARQLDASIPQEKMKVLLCPSDDPAIIERKLARQGANRRTYAMPENRPPRLDWPPGSNSNTGIGVRLNLPSGAKGKAESQTQQAAVNPSPFAAGGVITNAFALPMILKPSTTIALAEQVHPKNIIGNTLACTIPNATEHIHYELSIKTKDYHGGRFNYLMLDGHVESLEPLATLSSTNSPPSMQSGMWTVNPSD